VIRGQIRFGRKIGATRIIVLMMHPPAGLNSETRKIGASA